MLGNGMNPKQIAFSLLQQHPQVANSPQGQQLLQILQNGDDKAGQEMAMNICNSCGTTPQNMLLQATNFFKTRF